MLESLRIIIVLVAVAVVAVIATIGVLKRRQQQRQTPELGELDDIIYPKTDNNILSVRKVEADEEPSLTVNADTKPHFKWQAADPLLDEIPPAPQPSTSSEIITLHILPQAGCVLMGYELLQAILATGLRYGDMKIFHRYQHKNAQGSILFSLASLTEPGTFDIHHMAAYQCRGLTLFMQTAKVEDSQAVYSLMLNTAQQLADDLAAHVVDAQHQPLESAMTS